MAGVQTPARRLLTEASAGAAVGSTTAPLGVALDARYPQKSTAGQPSGYATLGADGKVPAAQLPAGSAPVTKTKTTDTTRTNTATLADDPDLVFTGLAAGVYQLTGGLFWNNGGSSANFVFQFFNNGALFPTTSATLNAGAVQWPTVGTAPLTSVASIGGTGQDQAGFVLGVMRVAAGTVSLRWAQSAAAAQNFVLRSGSWLRLERVAA